MNYTGGPSISGCRPVLSLYPTHYFCQYLLGIFITFTNSSLFCRAFSTNSRRALRQRLSLWERSSTSPSRLTPCHCPGCGSQRLLRCRSHPAGRGPNSSSLFPPLAAVVAVAPTEGRPWHSGKLLLFARGSPTRGAVERSETERLYEGKPNREPLLDSTSPSALTRCHLPYRGEALAVPAKRTVSPEAPLLGELSNGVRLRGCTKTGLPSAASPAL